MANIRGLSSLDVLGGLPDYATDWLTTTESVPTPNAEMLQKYLPITMESLIMNVEVKFSMLPHFERDNMWFASTLPETPNSLPVKSVLSAYGVPPQTVHARTILDLRTNNTRMLEVVRFDDDSLCCSKTVRYENGDIKTVSHFLPSSTSEFKEEFCLRRDTVFECRFCAFLRVECQCPPSLKMRSCSSGLTSLNNNSTKRLHWTALRTFMGNVFNHNVGRTHLSMYVSRGANKWGRISQRNCIVRYLSHDNEDGLLEKEKDKYILESFALLSPRGLLRFKFESDVSASEGWNSSYRFYDGMENERNSYSIIDPLAEDGVLKVELGLQSSLMSGDSLLSNENEVDSQAFNESARLALQYSGTGTSLQTEEVQNAKRVFTSLEDDLMDAVHSEASKQSAESDQVAKKRRLANPKDGSSLVCELCSKEFKRKYDLRRHITTVHEKVRKFGCNMCDLRFLQRAHLTEHISCVHERRKSNFCAKCDLTFSSKSRLVRHDRAVHQKLRPYVCGVCNNKYFQRTDLKKHQDAKHANVF
uniref:C2H2-type domain-containing protein n=1 Tax=Rhodosorus marinus TaxID=101924 RepID=A0A7S0BI92_9RHOD|mmetsp:Transcript_17966/g.25942  ORF Transcript_17966/g.25942 Transcript_17966/m.25942 type:complete len:531 (+) Transcript_17966:412-2004(+)